MKADLRSTVHEFLVQHRRVNIISQLQASDLCAKMELALEAARKAEFSPDQGLRETAEKLLAGLATEVARPP